MDTPPPASVIDSELKYSVGKKSQLGSNSKSRQHNIYNSVGKDRKSKSIEPALKHYYSNTKRLISQAVKVLDGEKAYNEANLDQFLMGIKNI